MKKTREREDDEKSRRNMEEEEEFGINFCNFVDSLIWYYKTNLHVHTPNVFLD